MDALVERKISQHVWICIVANGAIPTSKLREGRVEWIQELWVLQINQVTLFSHLPNMPRLQEATAIRQPRPPR